MRHPTRAAIDKFNELFGFSEDQYMQEWEIECAVWNAILDIYDNHKIA